MTDLRMLATDPKPLASAMSWNETGEFERNDATACWVRTARSASETLAPCLANWRSRVRRETPSSTAMWWTLSEARE